MNDIHLVPVKSSQFSHIGHDPLTSTMAVRFHATKNSPQGSLYHYSGVSSRDFNNLQKAASLGSHFIANFKKQPTRFPFTKVA